MAKISKEDLAAKIDWEGGLAESIFGYGMKSSELPDNAPAAVKQAWKQLEEVRPQADLINKWLWND